MSAYLKSVAVCHKETHDSDTMLSTWQGMPFLKERHELFFQDNACRLTDAPFSSAQQVRFALALLLY